MIQSIKKVFFPLKKVVVNFSSVEDGKVVITQNEYDRLVWDKIKSWYLVNVPYSWIDEVY